MNIIDMHFRTKYIMSRDTPTIACRTSPTTDPTILKQSKDAIQTLKEEHLRCFSRKKSLIYAHAQTHTWAKGFMKNNNAQILDKTYFIW